MKQSRTTSKFRSLRIGLYVGALALLIVASGSWSAVNVSANHPVLLEGNCDSPVPGTTIVNIGQCGDFDGDGRIGTAEDTDGADRIFGTLLAALGPGTGAAAGTGANYNGRIVIVKSGRFAVDPLLIGTPIPALPGQGSATPGNVTIEAAPGVDAIIDAVLQGDPAGGNTARQAGPAITINYLTTDAVVTLRNLVIRNYAEGVVIANDSRVNIDNCRFENNRDNGVNAFDRSRVVITNSQFQANGFRIPVSGPSTPGAGLNVRNTAQVRIVDSVFAHNAGPGIINSTSSASNVVLYRVASYFNTPNISGAVTTAPDANSSSQ
jgi:hypothetical protein